MCRRASLRLASVFILIAVFIALSACTSPPSPIVEPEPPVPSQSSPPLTGQTPVPTEPPLPQPAIPEETPQPSPIDRPPVDEFAVWWQEYSQPFTTDTSSYPAFWRGAWASRLDEARSYLLNAPRLRQAGFDSIMLGIDIVFDPVTGEARSLADEVFIFYLQALRKAGFRVVLIPNPMHPNLDMGLGYEWEEYDPDAAYHRSPDLIRKLDNMVIKWAVISREHHADAFAPLNEPYKLVRDYQDASTWLQEIRPRIREVYYGPLWVVDTMHDDIVPGRSIPYPYDYHGYDLVLGGPPAGRSDVADYAEMLDGYIAKGIDYVSEYDLDGFGIYEWGAYTGGVWYEDGILALSQELAGQTVEATIRRSDGMITACFPRISLGWLDFDTTSFEALTAWYLSIGGTISSLDDKAWTRDELIEIERDLAGDDYEYIFRIE